VVFRGGNFGSRGGGGGTGIVVDGNLNRRSGGGEYGLGLRLRPVGVGL
jgi:hypothetical protein